jgi:AraC-like DNA-binding protein
MSQSTREYYRTMAEKICRYIESRHEEDIHMSDILKYFYISEKRCRSIINRYLRTSFPRLLNTVRLYKTIRLYSAVSQHSIVQAAIDSGFMDKQNFIYWWKRCTSIAIPKKGEKIPTFATLLNEESLSIITVFRELVKDRSE